MIYSFSNTTSYSEFYAFFSSFRIILWSKWLANNKRQSCFYPPLVTRTRRHAELTKKTDKPDGKPVLCQRTFSPVFRAVFFQQLNCTVQLTVYGDLNTPFDGREKQIDPSKNMSIYHCMTIFPLVTVCYTLRVTDASSTFYAQLSSYTVYVMEFGHSCNQTYYCRKYPV